MKRKHWLTMVGMATGLLCAASAYASISRDADGVYVWEKTTITDANGRVLKVIGDDPTIRYTWNYVNTTGRYGGGDTASGRLTAKARAIALAAGCNAAFYTYGLFTTMQAGGSYWSKYCGVAPTNPDIRVMSNATAYFVFEDLTRAKWCSVARSAAATWNVSGPVYVSGNVRFFGDASGTEADEWRTLGSYAGVACY